MLKADSLKQTTVAGHPKNHDHSFNKYQQYIMYYKCAVRRISCDKNDPGNTEEDNLRDKGKIS